jgi:mRNA-degrading endonuclease RelE of RelBE toxin-antitoxin system
MIVVETPVFTQQICDLLPDDEYRRLQLALVLRPEQGALVPGGQGLRKLRWGQPGRGKRGGLRVLYYWDGEAETVYLLFVYAKTKQADLTPEQAKALGRLIREELK